MRLGFDRPTGSLLALGQPLFGHECDVEVVVVSQSLSLRHSFSRAGSANDRQTTNRLSRVSQIRKLRPILHFVCNWSHKIENRKKRNLHNNKQVTNWYSLTTQMSIRSDSVRSTNLLSDPSVAATLDLEQQIARVEEAIAPLRKLQKKLQQIEDELANTNYLIDSGIGSKKDKAALRQTKRELRERRITLWKRLEALPALVEERQNLLHQMEILRRRHGFL